MRTLVRKRVWVPAAGAVVAALIVAWFLVRDRTLQHIDPKTIRQSVGRKVRLKGVQSESRTIVFYDSAGSQYVIDRDIPANIPPGNEVLVTGRLSLVGTGRLLRLQDQRIVDLGTRPPPAPPPPPPPVPEMTIQVTAKQWSWSFRYPDGQLSDELHLPIGMPAKLELRSLDVIHGMELKLPDGRAGSSAVPGGVTEVVVVSRRAGRSRLYCSEYCGAKHSECGANVVVEDPADFKRWLAATPATQPSVP